MKSAHLICSLIILFVCTGLNAQWTYSVVDSYTDPAHSFYTASLKYDGSQTYYINQSNTVVQNINFTYFFLSDGHLVVRVIDPNNERWELPNSPPFPNADYSQK